VAGTAAGTALPDVQRLVEMNLDLRAVSLGHRDLVAVAGEVGRHLAGGAADEALDRRRVRLVRRIACDVEVSLEEDELDAAAARAEPPSANAVSTAAPPSTLMICFCM